MKITDIRLLPLTGATMDGGWDQGFQEAENLHTLVFCTSMQPSPARHT